MAALVAVMIMVSVGTLDWHGIQPATLRRMPKSETLVMLSTVAVVVATYNLAIGVIVGVLVAMVMFAGRVAHFTQVVDVAHSVAGSLVWGMALDGFRPDRYDIAGALLCLLGVAVIMYWPRPG